MAMMMMLLFHHMHSTLFHHNEYSVAILLALSFPSPSAAASLSSSSYECVGTYNETIIMFGMLVNDDVNLLVEFVVTSVSMLICSHKDN